MTDAAVSLPDTAERVSKKNLTAIIGILGSGAERKRDVTGMFPRSYFVCASMRRPIVHRLLIHGLLTGLEYDCHRFGRGRCRDLC